MSEARDGRRVRTMPARRSRSLPGCVDPVAETLAALRRKGFGRLLRRRPGRRRSRTSTPATLQRSADAAGDRRSAARSTATSATRLTDSIETAYREGGGAAFAIEMARDDAAPIARTVFTERFECRDVRHRLRGCRSRGCSRSTTRSARARPATASATSSSSTWIWSCRIRRKSIQQGAIEPWSKPHYRAQLAELKRAAKKARRPARRAVVAS